MMPFQAENLRTSELIYSLLQVLKPSIHQLTKSE